MSYPISFTISQVAPRDFVDKAAPMSRLGKGRNLVSTSFLSYDFFQVEGIKSASGSARVKPKRSKIDTNIDSMLNAPLSKEREPIYSAILSNLISGNESETSGSNSKYLNKLLASFSEETFPTISSGGESDRIFFL